MSILCPWEIYNPDLHKKHIFETDPFFMSIASKWAVCVNTNLKKMKRWETWKKKILSLLFQKLPSSHSAS